MFAGSLPIAKHRKEKMIGYPGNTEIIKTYGDRMQVEWLYGVEKTKEE